MEPHQPNQQQVATCKQPQSAMTATSLSPSSLVIQVPQHQQQQPQPNVQQFNQIHLSSSSNSTTSSSATSGPSPTTMDTSLSAASSVLSTSQHPGTKQNQNSQKISFHLKTSIFTRRITIDADKMALGSIKQLAVAFLNEIYFSHNYSADTYIGDYIRKHLNDGENLNALYERLILRKYLPQQETFVSFNSVSDIEQDSYICIEISERQSTLATHQYQKSTANTHTLPSLSPLVTSAQNLTNLITSGSGHRSSGSGAQCNQAASPNSAPSCYQLKISHDFHSESYYRPTYCASCGQLIKGLHKQGFQCNSCKKNFCPKCKQNAESTSEICYSPSLSSGSCNNPPNQNPQLTPTIVSHGLGGADASIVCAGSDSGSVQTNNNNGDKLDPAAMHSNMSKRKSASNILHSFIANPFKSHHSTNQQQQHQQHQNQRSSQDEKSNSSKSMRGSAGALGPVLQQLNKQMKNQDEQQISKFTVQQITTHQKHSKDRCSQQADCLSGPNGSNGPLLNVQIAQLSSSHQNLYSLNDREPSADNLSGCSSAHQSPSKGNIQQLSNSARTSARDLLHASSPTRRDQVSCHSFNEIELSALVVNANQEPLCDVCSKALKSNPKHLPLLRCKTCQLQVHAQCKDLALADCVSRIAESSRAAAERAELSNQQKPEAGSSQGKVDLRSTNSNVSRDNIRLHRLATKYHVKKPDSTKPIIEGWLQHKTTSDEQPRKHFWRLDEKDITLFENDTSARYFKAIALSKITRVISASSLPKFTKEDVALSLAKHHDKQQAKSANASPKRTDELKAQMNAMFAFEVSTGSIYLVQASDAKEANRWKGSLEAVTTKRALEQSGHTEFMTNAESVVADSERGNVMSSTDTQVAPSAESVVVESPQRRDIITPVSQPSSVSTGQQQQTQQRDTQTQPQAQVNKQMNDRQQHHHQYNRGHYHHHFGASSYRSQQKTFTDPTRSRLCNKPRIEIMLEPMSVPDHLIEGKYLIERNRQEGVGFEELGSGQFGKVYAAISEIKAVDRTRGIWSGIPVAIKEISKARFDLRQQAKLKNEANILSRLNHPGIIILERVHEQPDKLYIVMEQLEDDMLEMIVSTEDKRLNERVTKFLTFQILKALEYLHKENIAHCDLKPENVLLVERRSQFPQIKLCDFGFAKIIEGTSFRSSLIGTPAYLAPEVVKGEKYNRSVDLWSVGVIVYVSLSGEFPFNEGENIHDQISRANFMYPDQPWSRVTAGAKDFINRLLRVNSEKRLSARQALLDEWIQQDYQLWCDLCELEMRIGCRWVTDDTDHKRWTTYALRHNLAIPRAAIQLHQQWTLQEDPNAD